MLNPVVFSISRTQPPRRRLSSADVKKAVYHAKNICFNYEDTPECKAAWELVEELSATLNDQELDDKNRDRTARTELAKREYDV